MFSAYESSVQETLVAGKKSLNRTVLRLDPSTPESRITSKAIYAILPQLADFDDR